MHRRLILILIYLFLVGYTDSEICDAIKKTENSTKYPYGIKSVQCDGEKGCRQVCLKTIANNRWRFLWQCCESDFIVFLATRYCPDDQKNWIKNVKWFLKQGADNDKT